MLVGPALGSQSLDEQRHRIGVRRVAVVVAHRERSERHHVLAAQDQCLTTRRHDPQGRAGLQQAIDQRSRRSHHVLTVVEHHHGRPRFEVLDQTVLDRSTRRRLQTEQRRHLLDHGAVGLRQGEIDEPHTIRDVGLHAEARFDHQSGLAHPADTDHGHQSVRLHQIRQHAELTRVDRRSSPAESEGCRR